MQKNDEMETWMSPGQGASLQHLRETGGLKPVGSGSKTSSGREPPPYSDSGSLVELSRPWVKVRARAKARARVPVRLRAGARIIAVTAGRARAAMAL
jgi:hypothetical protein